MTEPKTDVKKSSVDRRSFLKGAAVGAAALAASHAIAGAQPSGAPQPASETAMRSVTLEEHFGTPEVLDALAKAWSGDPLEDDIRANRSKLIDLGNGRIAAMDAARIDVQVLSLFGIGMDRLDPASATTLAGEANDKLFTAVQAHPERFAALATLAMQQPEKAALEFERCVRRLGAKGIMVNGTTNGLFLDDPRYMPILETAQALDVPIYLHPGLPSAVARETYHRDLPRDLGFMFSIAGWGWHVETGMHCMRLIVSGVFDRFPRLKIILGHLGEGVPFFLVRSEDVLAPFVKGLQRPISDYFRENIHITTSGFFSVPPFLCALEVVGADRILFSVDYPFSPMTQGRSFLDALPVSPFDLAKIAHRNAERVLNL